VDKNSTWNSEGEVEMLIDLQLVIGYLYIVPLLTKLLAGGGMQPRLGWSIKPKQRKNTCNL